MGDKVGYLKANIAFALEREDIGEEIKTFFARNFAGRKADKEGVVLQLTFLGATREVTGSCYLLKTRDKNFLVDCGLIQGKGRREIITAFLFFSRNIDFILLTHAHLDHSGRIPALSSWVSRKI